MLRVATALTVRVAVVRAATDLAVQVAVVDAAMVQAVQEVERLKPELAAGLLHFEKAGKHLFFVQDIPNWLVVNSNSAVLLFHCDGRRSVGEILDSVGLEGQLRQDAHALFREAAIRGVFKHGLGQEAKECAALSPCTSSVARQAALLRSVYLKLTDECNLRCKYCYAGSGKPSDTLNINVLRRIIGEVAEISPRVEYVLSGGEPLLHPNALDFAEEAFAAGNAVQILTNGTLITDDEIAHRIAAITNLIKISVDGSTEAIHSISRGMGNYDQVTKAVDLLARHGANVQVAMTVTSGNVHDLANMAARYGSRLAIQPLFKAGRGKANANVGLTGEEYYHAMDDVENIAPMGNVAAVLEGLRGHGVKKCALADREISISERGDVYPCQLLHAPEFLAGNIYVAPLAEIYFNSPVLSRLRKVDVDSIQGCSQCPIRLICAGGCRARDFHENGSIEAVGEFCEYEKLAFINGLLDYSSFDSSG